jgi:two-component system chemotaxis response regulator CheY
LCKPVRIFGKSDWRVSAKEKSVKILIVEDEFISRTLLTEILSPYGVCHVATNGREAVEVLDRAYEKNFRYDLVCLDIMMPEMDGQEVLAKIRSMEDARGIGGVAATKVIMTTALDDSRNILEAFTQGHCEAYLTKPIDKERLIAHLRELQLIDGVSHANAD